MARIQRRTLNDASHKLDIAANLSKSGLKIDLPMDRYIARIGLVFEAQYDTGATAPVLNEDNPMSLLGNVALAINGRRERDVDFALLHYLNIYDYKGIVPSRQKTTTSTTQSNQKAEAVAFMDFRTEPSFPHGHPAAMDALLPAFDLSSLAILVDTKAVTDLASNTTLDSATLYPFIDEVIMTREEEASRFGANRERLIHIKQSQAEKVFSAANNYQFEVDLPTGNRLRRSLIKAVDNGVRSDSIVTDFRTKIDFLGVEDQWAWRAAQIDDRMLGLGKLTGLGELEATSGAAVIETIKGLVLNDYGDLAPLGVDLSGARAGAAKWQANVGTPTGTSKVVFLHEEVMSAANLFR